MPRPCDQQSDAAYLHGIAGVRGVSPAQDALPPPADKSWIVL